MKFENENSQFIDTTRFCRFRNSSRCSSGPVRKPTVPSFVPSWMTSGDGRSSRKGEVVHPGHSHFFLGTNPFLPRSPPCPAGKVSPPVTGGEVSDESKPPTLAFS
ncbi:Hypothetical protein NTJ_15068 [Nesidiocoris tenuis]|uniref:Uncharacterized protein n=1 Tax=Nesidiocoris tenuis TaxID=355587 RepID=A0ABN7BDB2_9HEMI|nr:Hypothetical protein NTJ_15068 [Nesidiocoris tenuis]